MFRSLSFKFRVYSSTFFVEDDDVVLIHDTARPLVTKEIIDRNVNALKDSDAVETAMQATDTIVKSNNNETITDIPVRKELYQGQTPQTFKYDLIIKAHEAVHAS